VRCCVSHLAFVVQGFKVEDLGFRVQGLERRGAEMRQAREPYKPGRLARSGLPGKARARIA